MLMSFTWARDSRNPVHAAHRFGDSSLFRLPVLRTVLGKTIHHLCPPCSDFRAHRLRISLIALEVRCHTLRVLIWAGLLANTQL